MSRSVYQVKLIGFAVLRLIIQTHGLCLNGNAPFPFYVHGIQNLILHFAFLQTAAVFNNPVGQSGLSVINMGNNRKVSD